MKVITLSKQFWKEEKSCGNLISQKNMLRMRRVTILKGNKTRRSITLMYYTNVIAMFYFPLRFLCNWKNNKEKTQTIREATSFCT